MSEMNSFGQVSPDMSGRLQSGEYMVPPALPVSLHGEVAMPGIEGPGRPPLTREQVLAATSGNLDAAARLRGEQLGLRHVDLKMWHFVTATDQRNAPPGFREEYLGNPFHLDLIKEYNYLIRQEAIAAGRPIHPSIADPLGYALDQISAAQQRILDPRYRQEAEQTIRLYAGQLTRLEKPAQDRFAIRATARVGDADIQFDPEVGRRVMTLRLGETYVTGGLARAMDDGSVERYVHESGYRLVNRPPIERRQGLRRPGDDLQMQGHWVQRADGIMVFVPAPGAPVPGVARRERIRPGGAVVAAAKEKLAGAVTGAVSTGKDWYAAADEYATSYSEFTRDKRAAGYHEILEAMAASSGVVRYENGALRRAKAVDLAKFAVAAGSGHLGHFAAQKAVLMWIAGSKTFAGLPQQDRVAIFEAAVEHGVLPRRAAGLASTIEDLPPGQREALKLLARQTGRAVGAQVMKRLPGGRREIQS